MGLARYERVIVDSAGNVVPFAQVQVRREAAGLPIVALYTDAEGTTSAGNPVTADVNGKVAFHVVGFRDGYRVRAFKAGTSFEDIRYNVPIGNAAAVDTDQIGIGSNTNATVNALSGLSAYDAELENYSVLVADIGDGRAAIYTKLSDTSADWSEPAIITGPAGVGTGLSFDVVVDDLTERALYDAEVEGFTALVSDSGDGRAAVYTKLSATSADWSDPNYLVGDRVDISIYVQDNPYSAEELAGHVFTNSVNFPAGLTGSQGFATDAPTADAVFTIKKNGSSIGTVTFADGDNTASFALSGGAVFAAGDVLTVVAPEPQDATLFQVSITLAGFRSPAS